MLPTIGRMVAVDQPQIQSFRLERHHLNRRLPAGGLVEAAAACGIQETPKLTAALALHARVDDVTVADFGRALKRDKTLLTVWAMRGAPYVVPTAEAAMAARPERGGWGPRALTKSRPSLFWAAGPHPHASGAQRSRASRCR